MGVCRQTFCQIARSPTFFSHSHETWHTCCTRQYAQNCGTDFRNFAFIFLNFKSAAELSRPTGLPSTYTT